MKLKLSFELSRYVVQDQDTCNFYLKTNYLLTSKHIVVIKKYYFHLLYIYIFDDFTRNSVCDLILLHAQKFNRACNKSVEDQGRRTRMGRVGNWSKLLWQKMKKNLVQLKPISILETQFWRSVLSLLLPPLSMNLRSSRDQESCFITKTTYILPPQYSVHLMAKR